MQQIAEIGPFCAALRRIGALAYTQPRPYGDRMRMKAPALLVAVSLSVSACATASSALELHRSIPDAPSASPDAPVSFATAVERGPLVGRAPHFDQRGHELSRFRSTPTAPPAPPGTATMIVSSVLLVGVGIAYLTGTIKRTRNGGIVIGKGRLSGGRAGLRVSPTTTGLAVKF